jgi:hypothetical protein
VDTVSRLIALATALLFSSGAFAYGLVTSTGNVNVTKYFASINGSYAGAGSLRDSMPAACEYVRSFYANANPTRTYAITSCPASPGPNYTLSCVLNSNGSDCGSVSSYTSQTTVSQPGCPANSTLSGSTCVCNLGFKGGGFNGASTASSCTAYTCDQKSLPSFTSTTRPTLDFGCESSGANAGCVSRDVLDAFTTSADGTRTYFGHGVLTGSACQEGGSNAGSEVAPPPQTPVAEHEPTQAEKCALGRGNPMCAAVVNGANVCVSCTSSESTTTETAATPAGAASAPQGVTPGTTTTTTSCTGNACSQVRTTKDANGNTTSVTTSTGSLGQIGAGSGSGAAGGGGEDGSAFGASCAAGAASITCEGDAVQCAIAREQYRRQCEFFEKTTDASAAATAAAAAGVGGDADHPGRHVQNTALGTFDQTDLIAGGGCPADRVIGTGIYAVTLPLSEICGPAAWLGNLLVALTAFSCVFIVFKGT